MDLCVLYIVFGRIRIAEKSASDARLSLLFWVEIIMG